MTVRTGMASLIARLRRFVNEAGTATFGDEDLQNILDEHKTRVWREPLAMERTLISSTDYEYKIYRSRYGNFEAGGTAYFNVEDATGNQRGTSTYTVDYIRGQITMTADQQGSALYLTGWSYDLNGAAADVWREKAGNVAAYYDVSMDGHSLSRSQWTRQCLDMAKYYESHAEARKVRFWRVGDGDDDV